MRPKKMFKRKEWVRPPRPPIQLSQTKSRGKIVRCDEGSEGVQKTDYVRSPALMRAYRRLPCQNCGADDGTVCGAHSNWAEHGKAKQRKASDIYCASLCYRCHSDLDQGAWMPGAERYLMWSRAHTLTIATLIAKSQEPGREAMRLRETLRQVGLVK